MLKLSINEITEHSGPFIHNKEKCMIFVLSLICYCFMCLIVHHEFSVLEQARREHPFVCNWSYRGLGAGVWVLGAEGEFCTKAASTLNLWAILSAPCVRFLRKGWVKSQFFTLIFTCSFPHYFHASVLFFLHLFVETYV